jgi:hypothetical protein
MIWWRSAICIIVSLVDGAACFAANSAPYGFKESIDHGVIDFVTNPWAQPDVSTDLDAIGRLRPGLVNRLGFEYGGVSEKRLNFSGNVASEIHKILPLTRIGGGFPENLRADYKESLPCDSEADLRTFSHDGLTGKAFDKDGNYFWIDPSLKPAQDYYICIGKAQIRRHFNHFHFEEADNILANCTVWSACVTGYRRVQGELQEYAKEMGVALSFSGEPKLSQELTLDSVYIPARFYIDDFYQKYRNKMKTVVGNGYTYVLSPQIVQDVLGEVPKTTRVLFYVDNFDPRQDDLRRMMELDGPNRRELIIRSAKVAAKYGAIFIPSYNHCNGCVPSNVVGDSCEVGPKASVYNARVCGDLQAIKTSLAAERRS